MRWKFFNLNAASKDIIAKNDYTKIENRPEGVTRKKDVKQEGPTNKAEGIWSLNTMKADRCISDELIRFVIIQERDRRLAGDTSIKEIKHLGNINHHHVSAFL
jgi:hypothetical protein